MNNVLYALDFDGVICDSAVETGMTGWKVACKLWSDMPTDMPDDILELFRYVRPVMETGYEAALIVRLLHEGQEPETLLNSFNKSIAHLIRRDELTIDELKKLFGETRDQWIAENLDQWIEMNPLFDGVADKIRSIEPSQCFVITTKQERFVHQIFAANNIVVAPEQVYGLDRNLPKPEILADLVRSRPEQHIIFVEDRLPTLFNVIDDVRLPSVELVFANWGYNTLSDKQTAQANDRINIIDLADFSEL